MRIGIDAHILGKGKGGVETALQGVIEALWQIDRENEYLLYVGPRHPFEARSMPGNFRLRPLPVANPWIERPLVIPYLYWRDRLDLIHLQRISPPWGCRKCVLHVHDLLYETHPQFFSPLKRRLFNAMGRASSRRAAHIVTVTENSAQDIQRIHGVPANRITVISNGVAPELFHSGLAPGQTEAAFARLGVARPFVLVVGMIERHKNTHVAVEAFERFANKHPEYSLVIAGQARSESRRGYPEELREAIARSGHASRIVVTGYVSNADRLALLNGAGMLLFPGAAEGFGLPPLEAMACGVPVVVAETPVAREVYGGASLMMPANDAEAAAEIMHLLAGDEALRCRLIAAGLDRAAGFRWEIVAERLLAVYEKVGKKANGKLGANDDV